MTARGRGLAILTGLAVFVAGWVMFVSRWSGPAGAGPNGRGAVAGTHAADLDAFRNELLVWAPVVALVVVLGLWPGWLLDASDPVVQTLLSAQRVIVD